MPEDLLYVILNFGKLTINTDHHKWHSTNGTILEVVQHLGAEPRLKGIKVSKGTSKDIPGAWKDGSVVKRACYSSRERELSSEHLD